jgi:hypothetical protein
MDRLRRCVRISEEALVDEIHEVIRRVTRLADRHIEYDWSILKGRLQRTMRKQDQAARSRSRSWSKRESRVIYQAARTAERDWNETYARVWKVRPPRSSVRFTFKLFDTEETTRKPLSYETTHLAVLLARQDYSYSHLTERIIRDAANLAALGESARAAAAEGRETGEFVLLAQAIMFRNTYGDLTWNAGLARTCRKFGYDQHIRLDDLAVDLQRGVASATEPVIGLRLLHAVPNRRKISKAQAAKRLQAICQAVAIRRTPDIPALVDERTVRESKICYEAAALATWLGWRAWRIGNLDVAAIVSDAVNLRTLGLAVRNAVEAGRPADQFVKLADAIAAIYKAEIVDVRDAHGLTMGLRFLDSRLRGTPHNPVFIA